MKKYNLSEIIDERGNNDTHRDLSLLSPERDYVFLFLTQVIGFQIIQAVL